MTQFPQITFDAARAKAMKPFHATMTATNARTESGSIKDDPALAKNLFNLTGGIMGATLPLSRDNADVLTGAIVSAAKELMKNPKYVKRLIETLPIIAETINQNASPIEAPLLGQKFKKTIQSAKKTLG